MIQGINVKSLPKELRKEISRIFYGLVPCDGKTRNLKVILANPDKYAKLAQRVEDAKKR